MSPRRDLLSLLLGASLLTGGVHAQITPEEIDQLVEHAMHEFGVVGAAVGVVVDGEVYHCRGYGRRSIDADELVTPHTPFAIASNSKAFTTAALAILVDEGVLRWQDKVRQYIPEFEMYDPYVTANFLIEDLLTHRSGLGLGAGDLMFFPDGADFTMADVLTCFRHFEPQSAFRTRFDYDNLLYLVAGEVIRRVTGESWESFVQTRILDTLEMHDSCTSLPAVADRGAFAIPHADTGGPVRTVGFLFDDPEKINGAAGGIFASAHDLCRWMLLQLNGGRHGSQLEQQLFSKARQEEMWRVHTVQPARSSERYRSHFAGYGLGWGLRDVAGYLCVSHTGGLPGMLSRTTLFPDLNLGVVVLTNTADGGAGLFQAVTNTITDRYLGLDDHGWTDRLVAAFRAGTAAADQVSARVWEQVEAARGTPVDAASYVGLYRDPWFGVVEVLLEGDQLWMKSHRSPKLNGPMRYYKASTFAIRWEYQDMNADAFASFALDEEGKAQRIEMKGISPAIDFSFDFQDLDLRRVPPAR